jgi:hypothetical protein
MINKIFEFIVTGTACDNFFTSLVSKLINRAPPGIIPYPPQARRVNRLTKEACQQYNQTIIKQKELLQNSIT